MTKFQWAVIGILTVAVIGVISVLALLAVVSMPTLIAPARQNSLVVATVTAPATTFLIATTVPITIGIDLGDYPLTASNKCGIISLQASSRKDIDHEKVTEI